MQRGFSLVELSIVLVILGLLTGGILAGQSLIRAAELRSVSTSVSSYMTAAYAFRDKYFQLPGDMSNASTIWTTCADVANNPCNGNGNNIIENISGSQAEELRFWQQLSLAGLVEGGFTGLDATPHFAPGTNVPRAKLNNAAYRFATSSLYGRSGNSINLTNPTSNTSYWQYVIRPTEAWNIDTKMDDGLADAGKVMTLNGHNGTSFVTNCVTAVSQWVAPATYNLSTAEPVCAMLFYAQ